MQIHELKIYPPHMNEIEKGNKPYEIRYDDRGFREGDYIHLRGFDNGYAGGDQLVRIKRILRDLPGIQEGYVVLTIENVDV